VLDEDEDQVRIDMEPPVNFKGKHGFKRKDQHIPFQVQAFSNKKFISKTLLPWVYQRIQETLLSR
jgi:hypothetical protein